MVICDKQMGDMHGRCGWMGLRKAYGMGFGDWRFPGLVRLLNSVVSLRRTVRRRALCETGNGSGCAGRSLQNGSPYICVCRCALMGRTFHRDKCKSPEPQKNPGPGKGLHLKLHSLRGTSECEATWERGADLDHRLSPCCRGG